MIALPDIGSSLPETFLRTAVVYRFLVMVLRRILGDVGRAADSSSERPVT
jgi:hypothetical protein